MLFFVIIKGSYFPLLFIGLIHVEFKYTGVNAARLSYYN